MTSRVHRALTLVGAVLLLAMIAMSLMVKQWQDRDAIMRADPEAILGNPVLEPIAISIGRKGFAEHCTRCHGTGKGDAGRGMPDLTDGEFLFGQGQITEIETIILHGIRSGDARGWDLADMPAYGRLRPYRREPIPPLQPSQINDVTQFLVQLRGGTADLPSAVRGKMLFKGSGACWDCHGPDAGGDTAIGAPSLADDIWLYGDGSSSAISASITDGRGGRSPAFARHITASDARAIAVYVASLSRHQKKDPHGE